MQTVVAGSGRWVVPRVVAPVPNEDGHYFFGARAAFDVCDAIDAQDE